MQTMESFVETLNPDWKFLVDFEYLEKYLSTFTGNRPVYMCNVLHRNTELVDWLNSVIRDNVPTQDYGTFIGQRGIAALFYNKGWLEIENIGYFTHGLIAGNLSADMSDSEYMVSNELRLKFVRLVITKIERTWYV